MSTLVAFTMDPKATPSSYPNKSTPTRIYGDPAAAEPPRPPPSRPSLPVDEVPPHALGAQHAPAPEAGHAVPYPAARLTEREPAELQGRTWRQEVPPLLACLPPSGGAAAAVQKGRDAQGSPVGGRVDGVGAERGDEW